RRSALRTMSARPRPSRNRRAISRAPIRSRKLHSPPWGWTRSYSTRSRTTAGSSPTASGSCSRRIAPAPAGSGGSRSTRRSMAFSLRQSAPICSARASLAWRRPSASCTTLRRPIATIAVLCARPRRKVPPRFSTSLATRAFGTRAKPPMTLTTLPARSTTAASSGGFGLTLLLLPGGRRLGRALAARGGLARLALGRRLGFLERALERVHQVDHLAALRRLGDHRLLALELGLDHLEQGFLVAVAELARVELARLLLDQPLRQLEHLLLGLLVPDVLEVGCGVAHLVRGAQGHHQEALVAAHQRDQPLALGQHHARERHLLLLAHGPLDHAEGLLGDRTVGSDVVGRVEVDRV